MFINNVWEMYATLCVRDYCNYIYILYLLFVRNNKDFRNKNFFIFSKNFLIVLEPFGFD